MFYCKEELPCGTIVEFEINFPGFPVPIRAVGNVVRVNALNKVEGFEVSAEFISVDEEAKEFINSKIQSVSEKLENK